MQRILNHFRGKINTLAGKVKNSSKALQNKDIFTVIVIILVAFGSFGLGRLSKIEDSREPVTVETIPAGGNPSAVKSGQTTTVAGALNQVKTTVPAGKSYVASKNGAKYFLTWCSGANTIKDANKVWFSTKEEAEAAGFTSAANCPGI